MHYRVDDEGVECSIDIDGFGTIIFVFAEAQEFCKNLQYWVDDVKITLPKIYNVIKKNIDEYIRRVYLTNSSIYVLRHVYIYPDDEHGTFGLMFRLDIDTEHGLGVKIDKYQVKKVGAEEVAFSAS